MCLEDLRLGRGRYVGVVSGIAGGGTLTVPGNASRVALLVSFIGVSGFDSGGGVFAIDRLTVFYGTTAVGLPAMSLPAPAGLITLRIEDVGQLVQGPITFSLFSASGLASASVTEILTDVKAEAIGWN